MKDLELRSAAAYDLAESAIAAMRQVLVWPTPLNYELALHYVSDPTGPLARAVDDLIANGSFHSDDFGEQLAQKFLPRLNNQNEVLEAGEALERHIDHATQTLSEAAAGAANVRTVIAAAEEGVAGAKTLSAAREHLQAASAAMQLAAVAAERQERRLRESTTRIDGLRRQMDRARREALTDPLTTLQNRRAFDREIARACVDSDSDRTELVLAMIDIDHFKCFNDTWGHQTGDQVIRFIASMLKAFAFPPRTASRYGGEEFALIMPRESVAGAFNQLDGLRSAVCARRPRRRTTGEELGHVTVSIGLARREPGEPVSSLIERADAALYASKRQGRNRTTAAPTASRTAAPIAA